MEQIRENKMGTASIPGLILKMSLPMMFSMLVLALYNVVDSIFVSRVSQNALTALSLAFPMQMLIVAFSVGTGVGVNSLLSRCLGAKDTDGASKAAVNGQFLAVCTGLVFTLVFLFFSDDMMRMFTKDAELLQLSSGYLFICGVCSFFPMLSTMNEKTILSTGNTVLPMIVQLSGAIFNIIFDPILIFGYFGFPAMGVKGAALATVGGQFLGMILSYVFLLRNKSLNVRFRGFRPCPDTIRKIYVVGLPSIVMQAIGSVCNSGMNKILIFFTPTAVSVLGVYFKLQSFVFMPVFGMNSGTLPILAYNYGAGNKKRLLEALKCSLLYAVTIMLVGLCIFQLFPDVLLGFFDADEEMLYIGTKALRTISLCFPVAAVCIMLGTLFSATANGFYSLMVSLCRQLLAILPIAYVLAVTSGLDAVWFSYPLAEIVSLTVTIVFTVRTFKRNIAPMADR